jgi:hypothetical protein
MNNTVRLDPCGYDDLFQLCCATDMKEPPSPACQTQLILRLLEHFPDIGSAGTLGRGL